MANKRLETINGFQETVYCILSGEESFEQQLMKVFDFEPGRGFLVEMNEKEIVIKDYFHADRVASFKIISITDTDEQINLNWNHI